MPVPFYPTDLHLALYLHGLLVEARLVGIVKWLSPSAPTTGNPAGDVGSYREILNEVQLLLAYEEIADYTTELQIRQLRAVGAVFLWRAVLRALTTAYDFSSPTGGSLQRRQMRDAVKEYLAQAELDASSTGVDTTARPTISIVGVDYLGDPYTDPRAVYEERGRQRRRS